MWRALVVLVACNPSPSPSPSPNPAPVIEAIDAAPPPGDPPIRVLIDDVQAIPPVSAQLTKQDVANKLAFLRAPLRRCYLASLRKDPMLRGKLSMRLAIAPDGSAQASDVVAIEHAIGDCAASVAATWRFPSPGATAATFAVSFVMTSP